MDDVEWDAEQQRLVAPPTELQRSKLRSTLPICSGWFKLWLSYRGAGREQRGGTVGGMSLLSQLLLPPSRARTMCHSQCSALLATVASEPLARGAAVPIWNDGLLSWIGASHSQCCRCWYVIPTDSYLRPLIRVDAHYQ